MSTKIYNGYRIAPAAGLFEFTERLRAVMNPIRTRLDARMLMDRAVTAVDAADARGVARPQNALLAALSAFDDEQRVMDSRQRGHDPHRFEVSFGYDQQTGRVLCLLYTDRREFTEAWEALPEVEAYGYWDNADRPGDMTEAEWEERRDAWERVMPGCTPPAERMVSFSLRSPSPHGSGMADLVLPRGDETAEAERKALLRSVARTKRARARDLAVRLLAREALRRFEEAGGPVDSKPDTVRIVRHFLSTTPTDADNYEAVVDACQAALNDFIDYVTGDAGSGSCAHPLDLTAALSAVTEHLNEASPRLRAQARDPGPGEAWPAGRPVTATAPARSLTGRRTLFEPRPRGALRASRAQCGPLMPGHRTPNHNECIMQITFI